MFSNSSACSIKYLGKDMKCAHQIRSDDELAEGLRDHLLCVLECLHGHGKETVSYLVTDMTEPRQRARVWLDGTFRRLRGCNMVDSYRTGVL